MTSELEYGTINEALHVIEVRTESMQASGACQAKQKSVMVRDSVKEIRCRENECANGAIRRRDECCSDVWGTFKCQTRRVACRIRVKQVKQNSMAEKQFCH